MRLHRQPPDAGTAIRGLVAGPLLAGPLLAGLLAALLLAGMLACGPGGETARQDVAPVTAKPKHPQQQDLSRFMPREHRLQAALSEGNLFNKETLPQATLAEYRKGSKTYQQFLFKAQNTGMAAVYLGHVKDAMTEAKFVAGFGGYFGQVDGKPVFVFVKNEYVTGLVGLSRDDADAEGRLVAVRIP
ncbi:MAG: hypothetical protein MUF01_04580 [Bryobacterales bacterium]|jgi:hypothetical protein|nr:hypothetical protein [Bryobacterales bacterium]